MWGAVCREQISFGKELQAGAKRTPTRFKRYDRAVQLCLSLERSVDSQMLGCLSDNTGLLMFQDKANSVEKLSRNAHDRLVLGHPSREHVEG